MFVFSGLTSDPAQNKSQLSKSVLWLTLLVVVAVGGFSPAHSFGETQIIISYSFPLISEYEPPADRSLEGSITATISSDADISPVGNPAWLTKINSQQFTALFLWNDSTERLVRFVDSNLDTLDVTLLPEPNYPLNLANHSGPVFHIQTAAQNLWDQETGLYVWGNHNNHRQTGESWERPAVVEFYDENGILIFSEPIGLRINGQSSRDYKQKGLRLYFDDYGAYDTINYDFFHGGPTIFERLVLRGNRYPDFAISSALNEPLHQDLGHKGSRHRSVAVYLNNELWGAYSLRERLDDEFVEKTWQWADDGEFTLIKDHEAEVGDYAVWENFLAEFSGEGPFDSHLWFENVSSQMDLLAYIDWLMINVCGATSDNMGGKNLAVLQLGHGPWQYITWDEDILYQSPNLNANHFRFYSAENTAEFNEFKPPVWFSGGPWSFTWDWNNVLRALMQNAEFKSLLRHRGADLLAGPLSVEDSFARLDSIAGHQEPEWVNHSLRWNHSSIWYSYKRSLVETFITNRHPVVQNHLAEFLEYWAQPVEMVSLALSEQGSDFLVSWTTEREIDCAGFIVERSVGNDNSFETIASWSDNNDLVAIGGPNVEANYSFIDLNAPGNEDLWYRISWQSGEGDIIVLNWVETTQLSPAFALRLNEFLAVNNSVNPDEFGEYDDWVEIFNPSDESISLSGLFLSDDLSIPTQWALPDVELEGQGYLLVWCDNDLLQGPLHAAFKISGSGEELGLYSSIVSGNQAIDTIVFGAQQADVSWGRQSDGTGSWGAFTSPTPAASNSVVSAVSSPQLPLVSSVNAWPNPFNPSTLVTFELSSASQVKLQIFDIRGRQVAQLNNSILKAGTHNRRWDGRDSAGKKMASGLYFAVVQVQHNRHSIKLVLLN